MDQQTADFYENNAVSVSERYESVISPVAHLFPLAFPEKARVLDIGCGSGRDMASLATQGYYAYGLEPSSGLRAMAVGNHPELSSRIAAGTLPDLMQPFGGAFDGILCSAVLMHVPDSQLFDAALNIRALLKPHGRLLLSLPLSRGETLLDQRDANGRLFTPYAPEEITLLFERLGFQLIGRWDTGDALARVGTNWYTLLLELRNSGAQRPIDQIETILNRDRKEATYKLALFRALAQIATQESRRAVWLTHGEMGVPIDRVAELWLQYFWPIVAAERVVPQSQAEGAGGKPIKFRAALTELIAKFGNQGEHAGLSSWHLAWSSNRLELKAAAQLKVVLRTIADTIRDGPVAFSGGALETGPVFRFDAKARLIVMRSDLWSELTLLGHWISDAVIVRWAALTQKFAYRQGMTAGDVLPLLLARPEPQRATALARQIYQAAGVTRCTWSDKPLRQDFAVDHVIPFALWGNNDLWNLVPADPKTNGNKSDKLPASELLQTRRPQIIESWEYLRAELVEPFDRQAQHLLGKPLTANGGWKDELFSVLREAIEMTAIQRGVERWHPH
jgi:SAM-dependent methyltransferase